MVQTAAVAIELRRLYEAHDWQYQMAEDRLRRIEELEAERDALLEALEAMTDAFLDIEGSPSSMECDALDKAYAVIDAAREKP